METQQHNVFLVDLYPIFDRCSPSLLSSSPTLSNRDSSSVSHSSTSFSTSPSSSYLPPSDHTDNLLCLVKNKMNALLVNEKELLTTVFVLTSPGCSEGLETSKVLSHSKDTETSVIQNEDKIAAFFNAKQKADNLEIKRTRLVCDAGCEGFWNDVCHLLLTPVHKWSVVAVESCGFVGKEQVENQQRTDCAQKSVSTNAQNTRTVSVATKTRVQQFLQTLPSLLGPPEIDRSKLLLDLGGSFLHGYSTRRGGVTSKPTLCSMNMIYTDRKSDSPLVIEENRRRLASVGNFDFQNFHITRAEHGHRVWVVGEEQPDRFDAIVTDRYDVTIAAAGADCIPLLFADPVTMVIGAAHAGWKGTVERVAECVVNTMKEKFGCRPEDIRVAMGPGVKPGCFVLPADDAALFSDIHPSCLCDTADTSTHTIDQTFHQTPRSEGKAYDKQGFGSGNPLDLNQGPFSVRHIPTEQLKPKKPRMPKDPKRQWVFVDLQQANYHVLLHAGVKAEHIDTSTSHCTRCNPHLYFSNERDGFPFGNQIGFLFMPFEQK